MGSGIIKQLISSKDLTWSTPWEFFHKLDAIFHFRLDPCASQETTKCKTYFTEKENGLLQDWSEIGNAFVNPPYGRALPKWMQKCWKESLLGITTVMLIPARVDTTYWHEIAFCYARCICFIRGRLAFEKQGDTKQEQRQKLTAPFPNAIVVFGECNKKQMQQLEQLGYVMEVKPKFSDKQIQSFQLGIFESP